MKSPSILRDFSYLIFLLILQNKFNVMNVNNLVKMIKPFIQNYKVSNEGIENYKFINQLVEERFAWFKQIPDIIYFFDEELSLLWNNGGIETMLGYTENELINKYFSLKKFLYYLPDARTEQKRQALINNGDSFCSLLFVINKNRIKIPVCSQAELITENPLINRKIFIGYVQDLSCIFAANDELNRLLKIQIRIKENIAPLKLSFEEKRVLVAYMQKYTTQTVAESLFKDKKTIYWHRRMLKNKFKTLNFEQILITFALYHYGVD